MHHTVHSTNANIGGSFEGVHKRKMNGPSDASAVINYSAEVPDQVKFDVHEKMHVFLVLLRMAKK